MPREIHPDLLACLDRDNPRVHLVTEVAAPDVARVLRRASDQFFTSTGAGGPRVSETPSASTSASSSGALQLAGTSAELAAKTASLANDLFHLPWNEDPAKRLKALRWRVNPTLGPCLIRSFVAKIFRDTLLGFIAPTRFQLQIFRATRIVGVQRAPNGTTTPFNFWTFTPLLSAPPIVRSQDLTWVSDAADATFNLQNEGLILDGDPRGGGDADAAEQLAAYYFQVTQLDERTSDGSGVGYFWRCDTTSSKIVNNVGQFDRVFWKRDSGKDTEQWFEEVHGDIPGFQLNVESFPASSVIVYAIDLGAVPGAAPTGRIVFERALPAGCDATLELSTAGSGGPWTAVTHHDPVTAKQQTYHLRLTLESDASGRRTPVVNGVGIEFRTILDVTHEAVIRPLSIECSAPFLEPAIGEGQLSIQRTGRRDFEDSGTVLGSLHPATRLEVDTFVASDHPLVTRDKWLHLDRARVANREPTETGEEFALRSPLTRLKRKIPRRVESLNTVHIVASALAAGTQVTVNGSTPLQQTPYDNLGYYMRVRSSAAAGVQSGTIKPIAGSTDTDKLDFDAADPLQGQLQAGDIVEVHSGVYNTAPIEWIDDDLADIWWELLTLYLEVPPEEIGFAQVGRLGRSGLPPRVSDIAPGDATTQAKRKATRKITDRVEGLELVNQVSFLLGGVTLAVGGRICFVQIYPLRNGAGVVTVAPSPVVFTLDPRDYFRFKTPLGLEQRMTTVAANYGVNSAAADPEAFPVKTARWVDADALAWLTEQDLDLSGAAELPEEVTAWCYNTADAGLFLASETARMLVLVGSTGLREWPVPFREAALTMLPGDGVSLITQGYTDYDPTRQLPISGTVALRGVVIGVSEDRRSCTVLIPGLTGNVIQVQGGKEGAIGGTPGDPIPVPADFDVVTVIVPTETGGVVELACSYTKPTDTGFFDRMEYEVQQRRAGDLTDWEDLPVRVEQGGRDGSDRFKADWNTEYRITPVTVSAGATRTKGTGALIKIVSTGNNPVATPTIGTPVAYDTRIEYPITFDVNTARIMVWYTNTASSPGTATNRYKVGTPLAYEVHRGDGSAQTIPITLASGEWQVATFIPINALDQMGTPITVGPTQSTAQTLPPDITATPTEVSDTETTTTNRVTMPASGLAAGDKIVVFRDGIATGQEVDRTAGASATQDLVHQLLEPNTTYVWTYKLRNAAGFLSANFSPALVGTTDAGTIPTPSCVLSSYSGINQGFTVTITPGGNTPSGVTWHISHSQDGGSFVSTGQTSTSLTPFHGHAQTEDDQTCAVKVHGTKAGWTQSAQSAASATKTIPGAGGPL